MAAKIVVACGSGVATSATVAYKVQKLLTAEGIEADVQAVAVADLDEALKDADAYVAVVRPEREFDVPVFNGVAFLTGMNQDEELKRLADAVRDK
ncbi:MAG: PTS sugar transporter subunit IIB [Olsenella sp.]|jgi:PTS system galactitol-specific IIB component|nr:PTS sugar transporter subunit IIB [Olsenella sp.]MCI1792780.1 PTS sugar transporter subunit IIB [Olsenella sp.]MCI1810832.1 PTS sugar transporter subunit IIB [Olsenella sp.]MCI1878913.1 PTS sugar transporter subunit IIB [Olsenella sp.]